MAVLIAITLAAHVLSAVFWAGSTFTMARLSGLGGERLVVPQTGAAVVAILTGGYLWHTLHDKSFGTFEQVLLIGSVTALIAIVVQTVVGFRTIAALRHRRLDEKPAQHRIALAQRIAAGLLAVTVICMVVARYV